MGLDTSHDCWHGAYSAFDRFRNELAKAAGYDIASVVRDSGFHRDEILIDWGHVTEANLMGIWEKTPDDPLIVLIAHSDCEGVIKPEQAGPLADRMESLLDKLPGTPDFGHIGDWREKTQAFIDGLRLAVNRGEDVEFM
jgi:hypothetical protein